MRKLYQRFLKHITGGRGLIETVNMGANMGYKHLIEHPPRDLRNSFPEVYAYLQGLMGFEYEREQIKEAAEIATIRYIRHVADTHEDAEMMVPDNEAQPRKGKQ